MLVLRQTLAILIDAQRELRAAKLFWLAIALVALSVVAFAGLDISADRVGYLFFTIDDDPEYGPIVEQFGMDLIYRQLYVSFAVPYILNWGVVALGLFTTAGIIPAMIRGGTLDVSLSKPIGRVRLFLTRALSGLLFAVIQVSIFSLGWFLILGFRADSWDPRVFLAIPNVTLFFSYLYCIAVLVGLITRSSITAILLAVLAWLVFIGIQLAASVSLTQRELEHVRIEQRDAELQAAQESIERLDTRIAEQRALELEGDDADNRDYIVSTLTEQADAERRTLQSIEERRAEQTRKLAARERDFTLTNALYTITPKTGRTMELLQDWLIEDEVRTRRNDQREEAARSARAEIDADPEVQNNPTARFMTDLFVGTAERREASRRAEEIVRKRSDLWVLGTSVGFVAAILGIASLIFARKDF